MGLEPLDHFGAGAAGTTTLCGYEVVNVDMFSPSQFCSNYEAGNAQDFFI